MGAMKLIPASDVGVAMATGVLTLGLFGVALGIVAFATPASLGQRELVGFGIGFGLFVAVYFLSMRADVVLTGDSYAPHHRSVDESVRDQEEGKEQQAAVVAEIPTDAGVRDDPTDAEGNEEQESSAGRGTRERS